MKNAFITIIATALAAAALVAEAELPPVGTKVVDQKTGIEYIVVEVSSNIDGKTTTATELAIFERGLKRRPLEPEATKRLRDGPVFVTSLFQASGRAEHASYGKAIMGSYLYTIVVTARSEVVENTVTDSGRILVKERRKFLASRDTLSLSKIDAALALDTLPVDQVHDWCINVGSIAAGVAAKLGRLETAAGIGVGLATIETWYKVAKQIDGVSIRGILGIFGVDIPEPLEVLISEWFERYAKGEFDKVHACIQSIEGKSFIITYEQEASGKPLGITYRNEDGSQISEAEWEILRQANLFLDQNVVPNARCRVGDSWKVWADEVQELFGVAGNGRAEGQILVTREANQSNGDWTLRLSGTEVNFRDDYGSVSGKMQIKGGNGLVDAEKASVKALQATASASLSMMNKTRHAMFFEFVKRLDGNANLRFTLTTDPAPPAEKKASE